ncbi:hypothetical protein H8K90_00460 [Winogradskyella echinorum]|uniref:DoxX-like family protein n=1 Tax=Winogradskyella echinorum TaxID=538189 RepID=A0ABR6XWG2_9FLAO|nr:hypothetical protein [Winogradskyella echinorum]MBC3844837.1 hypothetical protein [Winogradskyella echinorum]MBC5749185.1 hypothetical protein [Winogradskyella echinorum]
MIGLLLTIANISGGVLLGLATLDKWDGESNFFNKIAGVLAPFQTVIGGALIVLAILVFWSGVLYNIVSILGGILLLTHVFGKVPALEASLRKLSSKLMPFKAIIGIALIVIGLIRLF